MAKTVKVLRVLECQCPDLPAQLTKLADTVKYVLPNTRTQRVFASSAIETVYEIVYEETVNV